MKKTLILLASALTMNIACSKINQDINNPSTTIISATTESSVKTCLGEREDGKYPVLWSATDRINVNGIVSEALAEGGSNTADFSFTTAVKHPYYAAYPAAAVSNHNSGSATITLPGSQNYVEGSFDPAAAVILAVANTGSSVAFNNAMAYISVDISKAGRDVSVSQIELTALGGRKLSGTFTTNYRTLSASSGASDKVVLDCKTPVALPARFIIAIPAQEYPEGISIKVKDDRSGYMVKESRQAADMKAGVIYTTSLTYGATGHDFDKTKALYIVGPDFGDWSIDTELNALYPVADNEYEAEDVYISKTSVFKFAKTEWSEEFLRDKNASGYWALKKRAAGESDVFFKLEDAPGNLKSGNYTVYVNLNNYTVKLTPAGSSSGETSPTEKLYANMQQLASSGTMFGMQMATIHGIDYSNTWYNSDNCDRSDVKSVTGSHPALYGWEAGHIEIGNAKNLDGDSFDVIRKHIKAAYARGGVNTISWHCNNPVTDGRYNSASSHPISHILPGGDKNAKFNGWLDAMAAFLLSLKDGNGNLIPILFRPWHEHTDRGVGSGFWWSVGNNSNEEYVALWRYTYDYLVNTKGLKHLLWVYSPDLHHLCWDEYGTNDKTVYLHAWPGDEYVDIMGLDLYQTPWSNFDAKAAEVVNYALSLAAGKDKLFAITETGFANNNPSHGKYGSNQYWWTQKLLPLFKGKKVSYVMSWRNDGYPDAGGQYPEYYGPFRGSYTEDDFKNFAADPAVILENDLPVMY